METINFNVNLQNKFNECINGYHMINTSPINETMWEDINSQIFTSVNINIYSKSNGGHSSGMDINSSIGKLSNKSAKYDSIHQKSFNISSYRLTTVCNDKHCGTPTDFITEINKRKNFDYYSILVRDELSYQNKIQYDWYLIPSDYIVLNPNSYTWEKIIGQRGKNKDNQIGWVTNEINGSKMKITFSMSSQLWISLSITDEIKKFIIASTIVENIPKFNYIDLYEKFVEFI
jgi:hypothetical protein